MNYCLKCNLPDTFPNISFDEGLCVFCRSNVEKPKIKKDTLGVDKLLDILNIKNAGTYDCIVPLSGGKDSSYILFYVVRHLKLKPLAVFFDNGFASSYAKDNVKNLCSKLNVELEISKISPYRLKMIQEAWFVNKYWESGHFGFCGNCENNIRTLAINTALKYNIEHILWGSTDYENSSDNFKDIEKPTFRNSFGVSGNPLKGVSKYMRFVYRILFLTRCSIIQKIKILYHYNKYLFYYVRDNLYLRAPAGIGIFNPYLEVSFIREKPKTIYFYEYINYDPEHQIKVLSEQADWKAPTGRALKMDCKLHTIGNYFHYRVKGVTDTGFKLSVLVRNNLLARSEAILREENEKQYIGEVFGSIGGKKAMDKIWEILSSNEYLV